MYALPDEGWPVQRASYKENRRGRPAGAYSHI